MSDDPLLGRTVAHFRVTALLGRGGMGAVYRAEDTRLMREVAIKVLPLELTGDRTRRARMLREARAAAQVTHRHVATVHEVGETEHGLVWIAMELVEGESLRARLHRGPLPLDEAVRIGGEIASAIGRAHERGIVHRDLKPENVMIDRDGHAKVLDFGLAKARDAAPTPTEPTEPGAAGATGDAITREGVVLGTPEYMSPEQARGRHVDARADVFSLGVMLHEMIAGERPFRGTTPIEVIASMLVDDPAPLPDVPEPLDAIVRRCLARDPSDRFADGRAVAAALSGTEAPSGASEPPDARPRTRNDIALLPTLPSDRRTAAAPRRRRTAVAAGLALAAIALAAVAASRSGSPRAVEPEPTAPAAAGRIDAVPRRLTTFGASALLSDVAISPDGSILAIAVDDRLEMRPIGGGEPRTITIAGASVVWSVRFTADGDRLLAGVVRAERPEVVEVALDGRELRAIDDARSAAAAPDGRRLALVADGRIDLEEESGARTTLLRTPSPSDGPPAWSRDGSSLAFVGGFATALTLRVATLDGRVQDVVTTPALHQATGLTSVAFDADRCVLFFASEPTPAAVLERSCPEGSRWSEPIPVVRVAGSFVPRFAIDPSGRALHAVLVTRQMELWIASLDDDGTIGERTSFARSDADERDAVWAPDGSLVFHSNRGGRWSIYRMPPDGGAVERLVDVDEHATYPAVDGAGTIRFLLLPREGGRPILARLAADGGVERGGSVGIYEQAVPVGRPSPRRTMLVCAAAVADRCAVVEVMDDHAVVSIVGDGGPPREVAARDVGDVALSPDGRVLATAEADGGRLVDLRDGTERAFARGASLESLSFSPDGDRLFATLFSHDAPQQIVEIDVASGTVVRSTSLPTFTQGPAVSPDGRRLAAAEMLFAADVYRIDLP